MQKPRKRFLSAIVAVAMCLSQFAPVTAYAVESSSGITQSEEAPKETDGLFAVFRVRVKSCTENLAVA